MQNVIRSLRPDKNFEGAKDSRSGTTWITVMYHETERHPDVVRYLWLKKYTSSRVWKEVTTGLTPSSRCYQDYERQLKKILKQLRKTFDTDEHLHKTERQFNNCVQGTDSVYVFIERLEDLSSELYHLGSPVLEYKMKWKLYNGLKGSELRLRVNDYPDDREVDYMELKEVVLRQHRRMANINETTESSRSFDKKARDDSRVAMVDGVKTVVIVIADLGNDKPLTLDVSLSTRSRLVTPQMTTRPVSITSIWDVIFLV
ncbi:hypothetical protein Pmar_PMAR027055 [Perkinsus marinus ATCC 50983]|uniref:Retrotransposon gag domain-containing protein n=1 Tax=Perkinsus marinus (strain ATCC 50983 / TXsc) TaxID=423536 RepID=C5KW46_PERM5|nr:hypothetical protein Pmar_PMAR027055 [Perkinsus marinus ATCC 50983]EER11300.1 hypothetical protein Pmar_PMAR027055 [Perkinsus marinus ATCC 50983]|eukprot:XP_002779505.1 hypothetical protein Pmar_PMAR027055 [Perkinsus marinus ATCC 50983]